MGRRAKTGSLALLALGVLGAASIHRATHGVWFARSRAPARWPAHADARVGRWTAWNPIPAGPSIRGVRGERPDDVWAWSDTGIMHWDGRAWTRVPRPARARGSIAGVGESAGHVWARMALHHRGHHSGCIVHNAYTETHDWCRAGDGWELGECGPRPPGSLPPARPPATIFETTSIGRDELARLWAAHPDSSLPPLALERGYRVGGGELWAVEQTGRWLAHFDGARWTAAANRPTGPIWLAAEDDGWMLADKTLYRWDGGDWKPAGEAPEHLTSIWGAAADDVWAVGSDGLTMHFDGARWTGQRLPGLASLTSVAGRARDDVWITGCAGGDFIAHWDGTGWTPRSIVGGNGPAASAGDVCPQLAVESGGRALAALGRRMFEFNAGVWEETPSPLADADGAPVAIGWLAGLAAAGDRPSGVWAVGSQNNGGSWTIDQEHDGIQRSTFSPFVVRRAGLIWKKEETSVAVGGASRIWVRALDDAWVVGANGLVLHFDGRSWTREESGTDEELIDIHGAGDVIWIVGAEGGLLRRRL